MAYDNVRYYLVGVKAAADLSAHQHKFMKMTATGVNIAGNNEVVEGVLENKPDALDREASVAIAPSTVKVQVGEALVVGDLVRCDAAGLAAKADATDDVAVGRCLVAGAIGSLATVQLMPYGRIL